jgi:hypothetical protein
MRNAIRILVALCAVFSSLSLCCSRSRHCYAIKWSIGVARKAGLGSDGFSSVWNLLGRLRFQ